MKRAVRIRCEFKMGGQETFHTPITMVNTNSQLQAACDRLSTHPSIAVDTEFLSSFTYYPKLCLVQIASEDEAIIIDPLESGLDLDPLKQLMINQSVLKVFYAYEQDFRVFHSIWKVIPSPAFDTRIAGMLCGLDANGYTTMVKQLLGHQIKNNQQRSRWERRPLSREQIEYAADDVRYLIGVYKKLRQQLNINGREGWCLEEMETMKDLDTFVRDPEVAWKQFHSSGKDKRQLAILFEIAKLRTECAQRLNRPLPWIMSDRLVKVVAVKRPQNEKDLKKLLFRRERYQHSIGPEILEAVKRGLQKNLDDLPEVKKEPRSAKSAAFQLLSALLDINSRSVSISREVIASNDDLKVLAGAKKPEQLDVAVMRGWRRRVFGNDALGLLEGKMAITVRSGRGRKIPTDKPERIDLKTSLGQPEVPLMLATP